MSTKHDGLTPAEQRYLEHAREAEKQGLSLLDYYRSAGLSVYSLYNVRRRLLRKGVVSSRRSARATGRRGAFVAVQVAQPRAAEEPRRSPAGMVCRLWHGSGWVIECGSWPPAAWLRECLEESHDARA
ncbi:MAG: hypothetical protein ACREU3_17445 [Steroidobacteraceae bacterium]